MAIAAVHTVAPYLQHHSCLTCPHLNRCTPPPRYIEKANGIHLDPIRTRSANRETSQCRQLLPSSRGPSAVRVFTKISLQLLDRGFDSPLRPPLSVARLGRAIA